VFDDFAHYRYGIYRRSRSAVLSGGHSVVIVGWGSERSQPFWLVANSWGNWGEAGLFRIARNTNEAGIEDQVIAGDPLL
jgi:cathepsin B